MFHNTYSAVSFSDINVQLYSRLPVIQTKFSYLAGIEPSISPSGANENVWNVLDVSGIPVHDLAHCVIYHGHGHFLKCGRQRALCERSSMLTRRSKYTIAR